MSEKDYDQSPLDSTSSPSQSNAAPEYVAAFDAKDAFTRKEKWFVVALIALGALFG
jgi:hypothetical protein